MQASNQGLVLVISAVLGLKTVPIFTTTRTLTNIAAKGAHIICSASILELVRFHQNAAGDRVKMIIILTKASVLKLTDSCSFVIKESSTISDDQSRNGVRQLIKIAYFNLVSTKANSNTKWRSSLVDLTPVIEKWVIGSYSSW